MNNLANHECHRSLFKNPYVNHFSIHSFTTLQAAKEATKMDSEEELIPVPFEVAKALVKRTFVDLEPQHPAVAESYKIVSMNKDNLVNNRKDACLLAQLRSWHCKKLTHY